MNCEDFNNIIDDLADNRPMSATIRDAGVSHAALCPDCAAKLADARAAGSCLIEAARAESEQAPAHVKATLLQAFAENVQSPKSNVQSQSQRTLADIRHWTLDVGRNRWLAAAAAIAAVILMAMVISVWRNVATPGTQTQPLQVSAPDTSVPPPPVNSSQPDSSPVREKTPAGEPRLNVRVATNNSRRSKRLLPGTGSSSQKYETVAQNTGQFVPLTYLAMGTAMDSGTVVRVELSRSALASLGFTGGVEGSAESVKADVILGDDGVARAIRLVE